MNGFKKELKSVDLDDEFKNKTVFLYIHYLLSLHVENGDHSQEVLPLYGKFFNGRGKSDWFFWKYMIKTCWILFQPNIVNKFYSLSVIEIFKNLRSEYPVFISYFL